MSDEVQAFARDNTIPQDQRRVTSLVLAGETCMTVLDEVDGVLDKHTGLASSKKRWVEVIKFVRRDVDALKSKLAHATALMQLALGSLTRYVHGECVVEQELYCPQKKRASSEEDPCLDIEYSIAIVENHLPQVFFHHRLVLSSCANCSESC